MYYNSNLTGVVADGYYHDVNLDKYYYVEGAGTVNEVDDCPGAPTATPVPTPTPTIACTGIDMQTVGSATSGAACSGASSDSRRRHDGALPEPGIGDTIFSNIDCSTTFAGGDLWYYVLEDTSAIQVGNDGVVIDKVIC